MLSTYNFYPSALDICFPTDIQPSLAGNIHYFIRPGLAKGHRYLLICYECRNTSEYFYIAHEIEFNPMVKQYIIKCAPKEPKIIDNDFEMILWCKGQYIPKNVIHAFIYYEKEYAK